MRKGDLSGPEAMMVAPATPLNSIFTALARRSAANMGEYFETSQRYMRLALKAQSQCRATIERLAAMTNPPVVIARRANISNGPQQINHGQPPRGEKKAPAGKAAASRNAFKGARRATRRADLAFMRLMINHLETETAC